MTGRPSAAPEFASQSDRQDYRIGVLEREVKELRADFRRFERMYQAISKLIALTPSLVQLEKHAAALATLADVADKIVDGVTRTSHEEIFWKELRRRVSPFKPLGVAVWLLLLGIGYAAGSTIWHFITTGRWP